MGGVEGEGRLLLLLVGDFLLGGVGDVGDFVDGGVGLFAGGFGFLLLLGDVYDSLAEFLALLGFLLGFFLRDFDLFPLFELLETEHHLF